MKRRTFMGIGLGAVCAASAEVKLTGDDDVPAVMTVRGPVPARELGFTLPHEHVMVDFAGADIASPDRYDADEVVRVAAPHLEALYAAGGRTLMECTPAYLARDPVLLQRLSETSGLHILTNTGYYGAAQDKFVPGHAYTEGAGDLARRWTAEWEHGIGDTGIRPGFIKIGVDSGPLSEIDRKLVEAAIQTHLATGLTIACHTTGAPALEGILKVFEASDAAPSALIWVHANTVDDSALHRRAAEAGMWVEFDGLGPDSVEQHVQLLRRMKDWGLLGRALLSHDAGWYSVGEPGGGAFRGFTTIFDEGLPALHAAGFSDDDIRQVTVANPAKAFAIGGESGAIEE